MKARFPRVQMPTAAELQQIFINDHDDKRLNGYWRVIKVSEQYVDLLKVGEVGASEDHLLSWKERLTPMDVIAFPKAKISAEGTVTNPEDKKG